MILEMYSEEFWAGYCHANGTEEFKHNDNTWVQCVVWQHQFNSEGIGIKDWDIIWYWQGEEE